MQYPDRPAWDDTPWGVWWLYYLETGSLNVCAGDAAAVLAEIYRGVGLRPAVSWTEGLQQKLIETAEGLRQGNPDWGPLVEALQRDLSSRVARSASVKFALYLRFYRQQGLRFDGIEVDASLSLPFGQRVGGRADGGIVCWNPNASRPPWEMTPSELQRALAASVRGYNISEPAYHEVQASQPHGASMEAVLAVGGLVILLSWLFSRDGSSRGR